MNLIGAVDRNWGIGRNNRLLVNIPSDMKLFRDYTMNKIIVAGRKTIETFQNGNPLINRVNIVLTKNSDFTLKNVNVVHSIEETFDLLEQLYLKGYTSKDVYIIGGESIYKQFLPYCDTAYITKIECEYEADAFFPNLDEMPDWQLVEHGDEQTYFDIEYDFRKYKKIKK